MPKTGIEDAELWLANANKTVPRSEPRRFKNTLVNFFDDIFHFGFHTLGCGPCVVDELDREKGTEKRYMVSCVVYALCKRRAFNLF